MNKASIVGNIDKRIIALPLARALSIVGKTAIVTNETEYRRVSIECEDTLSCGDVNIVITQDLEGFDIKDLEEQTSNSYTHIIYVSNSYIDKESKVVCLCREPERTFLPTGLMEQIKILSDQYEDKLKEIVLSANSTKDKSDTRYVLGSKEFKWLWDMEETKDLIPFSSKVLNSFLSSVGGAIAGMQEKSFEELLVRDYTVKSSNKRRGIIWR